VTKTVPNLTLKALHWQFSDEWSLIDAIDASNLHWIHRSALFNDHHRAVVDSMHSFSIMTDLIPILTDEYHEEVALILDASSVPHSSKVPRMVTRRTLCLKNARELLFLEVFSTDMLESSVTQMHHWFFFRATATLYHTDLICGTPCHGPSMHSFNYRLQTRTSVNWKCCNRLVHQ
jgi:hypothetical protein